jgi:hypothetical protein
VFWDTDGCSRVRAVLQQPLKSPSHWWSTASAGWNPPAAIFAHGYQGLLPWESAGRGETPVWAPAVRLNTTHLADVFLAAWQYHCDRRTRPGWVKKGWPILSATADFWASRAERNGPGHYDISTWWGRRVGRNGTQRLH